MTNCHFILLWISFSNCRFRTFNTASLPWSLFWFSIFEMLMHQWTFPRCWNATSESEETYNGFKLFNFEDASAWRLCLPKNKKKKKITEAKQHEREEVLWLVLRNQLVEFLSSSCIDENNSDPNYSQFCSTKTENFYVARLYIWIQRRLRWRKRMGEMVERRRAKMNTFLGLGSVRAFFYSSSSRYKV